MSETDVERGLLLLFGDLFRARGWKDDSRFGAELAQQLAGGRSVGSLKQSHAEREFLRVNRIETDVFVKAIEDTVARMRPRDPGPFFATLLFTDIVGSTTRAGELGDRAWRDLLGNHNRILVDAINEHGGTVVTGTGDGVLATFPTPTDALSAAHAARARLHEIGVQIRAGVHSTEVVPIDAGNIGGIGVHIAARVLSAAGNGEVLATEAVRGGSIGSEFTFDLVKEAELKGVEGVWRLYRATPRKRGSPA
jgi:class 3 adenylate cyclase